MTSSKVTVELVGQKLKEVLEEESKIYPLKFSDESGKQGIVILNHHLNRDSIDSIRVLANMHRGLDVGIIGRSIFESVLNMGLILYLPGKEGVDRYQLYLSIESLRVFKHMAEIEEDMAHRIYKPEEIKKWEADQQKYEKDYGVVTSSWLGISNIEICRILDREYPPVVKSDHFFEFMYCHLYRYGSSATHRSRQGIARHLNVIGASSKSGGRIFTATEREAGLVFNYFHSLIVFLLSMRIVGKAFNAPSLEDYSQKKVRFLVAGDKP